MNVVDSSAWLSYFTGDANAELFSRPIENIDKLIVPSITITEVFKCILRQRGEDMALEGIAHMEQGRVIPLDSSLAIDAAQCGVDYKLPLTDSIIYATAQKFDALIWTQDTDFESLEGVKYYSKSKSA
ncbi:MAG: type II toxin-antitoxin system VapC family toxin [Candidatus Thiodiazotropha sp. (ex Dulcina madagascariensis)]|nr:type II toxin-antitoxin system VapC family toxin [Candidatus Thiodiazotropha sp. (ex Dulcina madagascariensis)]MCU7926386.1 type II toxin-antitoxin system VapC family toxin [Candidatus Thiodiazotropha sp. (ex Dulcina madagascariensis)]